jgi:hypothetical protein
MRPQPPAAEKSPFLGQSTYNTFHRAVQGQAAAAVLPFDMNGFVANLPFTGSSNYRDDFRQQGGSRVASCKQPPRRPAQGLPLPLTSTYACSFTGPRQWPRPQPMRPLDARVAFRGAEARSEYRGQYLDKHGSPLNRCHYGD